MYLRLSSKLGCRLLKALPTALLAISFAAHADDAPEVISIDIPMGDPQAGMSFDFPDADAEAPSAQRPRELKVTAYGAVQGPKAVDDSACQIEPTGVRRIESAGWIRLGFVVPPKYQVPFERWLLSASGVPYTSNKALLQRLLNAASTGLDALQSSRGRPGSVEFQVHFVGDDCRAVLQHDLHPTAMLNHFAWPLAYNASWLFSGFDTSAPFHLSLFNVVAHEAAHIVQFMPFDESRYEHLMADRDASLRNGLVHTSLRVEQDAMLATQCLRQAALPQFLGEQSSARQWLADRSVFRSKGPMGNTLMWDHFFEWTHRILGDGFVSPVSDQALQTLFGYCAMALQRERITNDDTPTPQEQARGRQALAAIRAVTGVNRFAWLPYAPQTADRAAPR